MSYTDNSAFAGSRYELWPLGTLVEERSETGDAADLAPLSVGKQGVTAQLAGVAKSANTSSRKVVRAGDIAINSRSDRRGAAGLARQDGTISVVYSVMTPNPHLLDKEYAHHLFRSVPFQEEFFRFGTGIHWDLWSTRFTSMRQIPVPLPPLPTQRAIADYLDRETAEIDAMAAELDELVERLRDRREAVVGSEGVLDAPRVSLGMLCDFNSGGTPPTSDLSMWDESDTGTPWVAISDMSTVDSVSETKKSVTKLGIETARLPVGKPGTVLFAMYASVGAVSVLGINATWNQAILGLSPIEPETLSPDWLFHALTLLKPELPLYYRSNTQNNLNAEQVKALRIPLPSPDEQRRAIELIRSRQDEIDSMIADAQKLKALLAERRSALITEVVTGRKEVPVP
ncbi:restriction endonuclease subunit S [Dietzia sp. WMMA184]|uniref:restriction endonuclease subunit S n=1 Tax=Dietzia sp. WMMA184 TaxID=2039808 RepID=UPI000BDF805C|nr:restriction endonuclease subunit S [Dietzia sp. WMMA184]